MARDPYPDCWYPLYCPLSKNIITKYLGKR